MAMAMSEESRYQWLMRHIKTCPACEWGNEDNSSRLCGEAELYFSTAEALDPLPAAHEIRAAGGAMLPGFDDVARRPAERRQSWTG
jgi:hypothetical protein